nr:hypothetical protein [Polyangium fumosum]
MPRLHSGPDFVVDDAQLGHFNRHPVFFGARDADFGAALVRLLRLPPDEQAPVALPPEHLADGRECPRAGATSPSLRRLDASRVEVLREGPEALSSGVTTEDLADNLRFLLVDPVLDPRASIAVLHLDVVVPEDAAADVETFSRLRHQVLVGPLADLFPLELGGEVPDIDHELVDGTVDRHLLVREVIEEPDASIEQVLDEQRGAVRVAAEAGFVAHHNYIERAAFGGVEHGDESGPLLELSAAVIGVDEDVLRGELAALVGDVA